MSPEDSDVYVMSDGDDGEEWVSPTPVGSAVEAAICESTDLEADDLDALDAYVDIDDLRSVLQNGDGDAISFTVEGHGVTVHADGEIEVE